MQKTFLITGSTDGIGLETAKTLVMQGHHVLLHGRNKSKLESAVKTLMKLSESPRIESYLADLSNMSEVAAFAATIIEKHDKLDVLINNAGVYKTAEPLTQDGLDVRFAVNTIAPFLLTRNLLPLLGPNARVINLSSAAIAPVNIDALVGKTRIADDFNAYAQSKLALAMWSNTMAISVAKNGPVIISVNPGSLLATKMVKEGFNMAGHDIHIGVDILIRLSLDEEFASKSGQYFDNDAKKFLSPHADALNTQKCEQLVKAIESIINKR